MTLTQSYKNSAYKGLINEHGDGAWKESYAMANRFRQGFKQVLTDKEEVKIKKMLSEEAFTEPSWAEKQSYLLGYVRAIKDLKTLLD